MSKIVIILELLLGHSLIQEVRTENESNSHKRPEDVKSLTQLKPSRQYADCRNHFTSQLHLFKQKKVYCYMPRP